MCCLVFWTFHLITLDFCWPQVAETVKSETLHKGWRGLMYWYKPRNHGQNSSWVLRDDLAKNQNQKKWNLSSSQKDTKSCIESQDQDTSPFQPLCLPTCILFGAVIQPSLAICLGSSSWDGPLPCGFLRVMMVREQQAEVDCIEILFRSWPKPVLSSPFLPVPYPCKHSLALQRQNTESAHEFRNSLLLTS